MYKINTRKKTQGHYLLEKCYKHVSIGRSNYHLSFLFFVSTSSSSQTSSSLPFVSRTLRHDVVRGMMGMMRISMLVLPMIRP